MSISRMFGVGSSFRVSRNHDRRQNAGGTVIRSVPRPMVMLPIIGSAISVVRFAAGRSDQSAHASGVADKKVFPSTGVSFTVFISRLSDTQLKRYVSSCPDVSGRFAREELKDNILSISSSKQLARYISCFSDDQLTRVLPRLSDNHQFRLIDAIRHLSITQLKRLVRHLSTKPESKSFLLLRRLLEYPPSKTQFIRVASCLSINQLAATLRYLGVGQTQDVVELLSSARLKEIVSRLAGDAVYLIIPRLIQKCEGRKDYPGYDQAARVLSFARNDQLAEFYSNLTNNEIANILVSDKLSDEKADEIILFLRRRNETRGMDIDRLVDSLR